MEKNLKTSSRPLFKEKITNLNTGKSSFNGTIAFKRQHKIDIGAISFKTTH